MQVGLRISRVVEEKNRLSVFRPERWSGSVRSTKAGALKVGFRLRKLWTKVCICTSAKFTEGFVMSSDLLCQLFIYLPSALGCARTILSLRQATVISDPVLHKHTINGNDTERLSPCDHKRASKVTNYHVRNMMNAPLSSDRTWGGTVVN